MKPASFDLFQPQDWSETLNALKNYDKDAMIQSGRPWVIVKNDRVYVSYDISTMDPETMEENKDWQCAVSEYEITP